MYSFKELQFVPSPKDFGCYRNKLSDLAHKPWQHLRYLVWCQLPYASSSPAGGFTKTWVPSTQPETQGNPAMSWNLVRFSGAAWANKWALTVGLVLQVYTVYDIQNHWSRNSMAQMHNMINEFLQESEETPTVAVMLLMPCFAVFCLPTVDLLLLVDAQMLR